jgi:phosphohistidine phosphatase SixA
MTVRFLWMFLLILITATASSDESLWDKLRNDPNMVVLMRNSESGGNRDGANMLVWDATGKCKGESILTEEGRDQAKSIGIAFERYGIKPKVISSPMCRCTETAVIAFGGYITDPDLRQRSLEGVDGEEVFQAKTRSLLINHRGKTPIVFVNHRPNIDSLTMELINVGDLLIGAITEAGEVEVIGKIKLETE